MSADRKKILITGATGNIGLPITEILARKHDVWCLARFRNPEIRASLEALGVNTFAADLSRDSFHDLPRDFTHVMYAAIDREGAPVRKSHSDGIEEPAVGNAVEMSVHQIAMRSNAVGAARLMQHCHRASAFLFMSTFGVYRFVSHDHRYAETDQLGGHAPAMPSYPAGKIATEGAIMASAATLALPSVIARMNICYGSRGHGGLPVIQFREILAGRPILLPADGGVEWLSPIHTDDVARQVELLWDQASTDAKIFNWAGDDAVSVEELTRHMADLAGVQVRFERKEVTMATMASDNTLRQQHIGSCEVHWREGITRVLGDFFPELGGLRKAV